MKRIIRAFHNSMDALRYLSSTEAAFRLELVILAMAFPAAWVLSDTWRGFVFLIGSVMMIMIVEALNTGIEAACDAVTDEIHPEIKIAKDCGSLAVMLCALLAGSVWLIAAIEWVQGAIL